MEKDRGFQRAITGKVIQIIFVTVIWNILVLFFEINVREYRRDNQKWTIQRNWHHRVQKTKKHKTHYVLDTTMRKQTQIT
jgi:hypothetical protein